MIKMKKSRFVAAIAGTAILTLALCVCGIFAYTKVSGVAAVAEDDYKTLTDMGEKYGKLYALQTALEEKSIYDFDEEKAMDAVYRAMTDSLGDKYTAYLSAEELKEWTNYTQGTFTGVGIAFTRDEKTGKFLISSVLEDGPAQHAGLKAGDELLKVNGKTFTDAESMKEALRGEAGSTVKVTYRRGDKSKEASLVRGEVEETSVYGGVLEDKYGYIAITAFEQSTAEQFKAELSRLENKGLKGLIVDLRGNPGGLVEQSLEIADMLLSEGTITYTEDKQGEREYHNSDENCTKMKYVVLVDKGSASSSEILAAAVKDNGGGKVVGETTYGKGIIQGLIEFDDGTALRLTYMQYFSPKGEKIQGVGVKPDYEVKASSRDKKDKQLEKAIELLSENL